MSTIETTLTAVTEPIKATTVDASSPTSISAYVASQEAHDADISNTFVPQLNLIIGQTNTVIGELNTLASGVSTNAGIATTKAQLASDYAQKVNATVETGTYSSKEHAMGDLTTSGGSAKAWATDTASPDGTTSKSAKTLAEEAATSATNAYNSELAAAALLDSFDDRYLGSKAVAPTLDNDGNALLSGAIYWNTALSQMYVYNLSTTTWIALSFIPTDHNSLTNIGTRTHAQLESDIAGKQATLTFDTVPTDNSTNPVESGGVFDTLAGKLNTTGGNLTGAVNNTEIDKGTISTGTVTFTQSAGNVQRLQVGGALTIAVSGWAITGIFSDILLRLVNAGSATVTLPTINWIKPDGTLTTTFATYLTAIARPALQTSGVDFMYLFTLDGGTTLYGKLL